MFSIEFSNQAKKFLKNLDKHIAEKILKRIDRLKENPVPSDAKFIRRENSDMIFRYRIGDHRALYKFKEKVILITKLDKRPRIY